LRDFAEQAQGADVAVVYFAGHGIEIRDENWLIPVDAELHTDASASEEAIGLTSLMPIVSNARKLGLVILDSCRDNPFGRQMQLSQSSRALSARGLVAVEPPNSVLVVFAAKHGTTAEDGAGRNSPFTSALLRNLECRAAAFGAHQLLGDTLRSNQAMQSLARKSGFTFGASPDDWKLVRVTKEIDIAPKDIPCASWRLAAAQIASAAAQRSAGLRRLPTCARTSTRQRPGRTHATIYAAPKTGCSVLRGPCRRAPPASPAAPGGAPTSARRGCRS